MAVVVFFFSDSAVGLVGPKFLVEVNYARRESHAALHAQEARFQQAPSVEYRKKL